MSKDEQQELIDYIVFLNLEYNKSLNMITPDGIALIEKINNKYPNWRMFEYKTKLSDKIFKLIRKEEININKDEARKRLHTNLLKMIQADATGKDDEWTDAVHDLFKMIEDIYKEKVK